MGRLTLTCIVLCTLAFFGCAKTITSPGSALSPGGEFPDGQSGEPVVEFQSDRNFQETAATTLQNYNIYPSGQGVPGSMQLDGYSMPGPGAPHGIPFLPTQFAPPSNGLVVLDGYPHLDFGKVPLGTSQTKTLRVANVGRSAVLLAALEMNQPQGEVSHVSNTCSPVLLPMAECSIELRYAPAQKAELLLTARVVYLKRDGSIDATYRQIKGEGIDLPHRLGTGRYHACSTYEGKIYCWGRNQRGQLGDGSNSNSNVPVEVYGIEQGASHVAVGKYSTCALVDGQAKCWGYNGYGNLGNGSRTDNVAPHPVTGLEENVSSLDMDHQHACAVQNGAAKCWGYNGYGNLGDGSTATREIPVQVSGLTSGVKQVTTGKYHSCALLESGGVKCWGYNGYGQLGNGNRDRQTTPVQVAGLESGVVQIEAGHYRSCAVKQGGQLVCWGYNSYGEIGDGTTTYRKIPTPVTGMESGVAQVATGHYQTCAIRSQYGQSQAYCWGWNDKGGIGNGETRRRQKTPALVTGSLGVTHLDTHYGYACAAIAGRTHCWGYGEYGKLGRGASGNIKVPMPVTPEGEFQ